MTKHSTRFFCFFSLPFLLFAQNEFSGKEKNLVFTQVTVIDATGASPQPDMTVVITGNRITALGKTGKVKIPQEAQVIDAAGKFLIPGLWDMHVHWNLKEFVPLFIANGVTGVRIMWGRPHHHAWRTEIAGGKLVGPRMIIASPLIDGPKPIWPGSVAVSNETEARQAVLKAKEDGADFIKVYSLLPRAAYFALVDEAKKQGLPVAGHVPVLVRVLEASQAGQKTIEHLEGIFAACSPREEEWLAHNAQSLLDSSIYRFTAFLRDEARRLAEYDGQKAAHLFARLQQNDTWQCPTLTVLRSEAFLNDTSFTHDPRLKFMPRSVRDSWSPANDEEKTTEHYANARKVYAQSAELTSAMQRAGVGILAGTDALNPYCFPGFSLHDELALLVQAGLTPMAALQAATRNPAKCLGMLDSLGTIEKGKIADLVLLEANPLTDINNTKNLAAVVANGTFFSKTALQEMLANIEKIANKKALADTLLKTIAEQDVAAAIQQYHRLKATQTDEYDFGERELNRLGYRLLRAQKLPEAIAIFKLNVEVYPHSANAHDSLGEAYLAGGDQALAIASYKKSLALNPQNANALEMLQKLGSN
ncbi:amidohydrolase family protein [candidate division KSB1 bacterium]|nr:amidohydrolase family protein [candidate division KSB1 bacterium]